MIQPRSVLTTSALAFILFIFVASLWHLGPWDSVDIPATKSTLGSGPSTTADHKAADTKGTEQYNKPDYINSNTETKPTSPPAQTQYCKWIFAKYESSAYEQQWFQEVPHISPQNATGPNVCVAMQAEHHISAASQILSRTVSLLNIDKGIQWDKFNSSSAPHAADSFMSRMHYRRVCYDPQSQRFKPAAGSGVQLIEPLFGMLRDPFDIYCGTYNRDESISHPDPLYKVVDPGQSKLHILPQGYAPFAFTESASPISSSSEWFSHGIPPWHSSLRPVHSDIAGIGTAFAPPQNVHLDLGSSYFGGWSKFGESGEGSSNPAASGQWFYDNYHQRGQPFSRFIAVEVEVLNDTMAYQQIPSDLVGIYTLMNIPLTQEVSGTDKLNTLEMIKRIVKPEDFFVFKLDIDSAPIEEPIVQSLLADDPEHGGASALVDELMFEHHANFYPMNKPWKLENAGPEVANLMTSYELFRGLRRKGIRAHSWP